jgi:hypothetical protein
VKRGLTDQVRGFSGAEDDSEGSYGVDTAVHEETPLVLGHVTPFGSVVFRSGLDVVDDLDVVVKDRPQGGFAGTDQLGRTKHGGLVSKVLGDPPFEVLSLVLELGFVHLDELLGAGHVRSDGFL